MNLCKEPHKHHTRFKIIWTCSSKEEKSFSHSETRIADGGYIFLLDQNRNFIENLKNMIHTKFGYNLSCSFRGDENKMWKVNDDKDDDGHNVIVIAHRPYPLGQVS